MNMEMLCLWAWKQACRMMGRSACASFAILSEGNKHILDIIWVHSRMRRKGLGTHLVKKLAIKTTSRQLAGSEQFWKACGLQQSLASVKDFSKFPKNDFDELFGYWNKVGSIAAPSVSPAVGARKYKKLGDADKAAIDACFKNIGMTAESAFNI